MDSPAAPKMSVSDFRFVVRLDAHNCKMASALALDLKHEKFTDLEIKCKKDGGNVKAHRAVIALWSDMAHAEGKVVAVDGVATAVMQKVLQFVYTGETDLVDTSLEELTQAMIAVGVKCFKDIVIVAEGTDSKVKVEAEAKDNATEKGDRAKVDADIAQNAKDVQGTPTQPKRSKPSGDACDSPDSEGGNGCGKCTRRFLTEAGLARHDSEVHGGGKQYECKYCAGAYAKEARVLRHMERCPAKNKPAGVLTPSRAEREKRYNCNRCDKGYFWPNHLTRHTENAHKKESVKTPRVGTVDQNETPKRAAAAVEEAVSRPKRQKSMGLVILSSPSGTAVKDGEHRCDRCGTTYNHFSSLMRHNETKHGDVDVGTENIALAPKTRFSFTPKTKLSLTSNTKLVRCNFCREKFATPSEHSAHVKSVHYSVVSRPVTQAVYRNKRVNAHRRLLNKPGKNSRKALYKCSQCLVKLISQEARIQHVIRVHGDSGKKTPAPRSSRDGDGFEVIDLQEGSVEAAAGQQIDVVSSIDISNSVEKTAVAEVEMEEEKCAEIEVVADPLDTTAFFSTQMSSADSASKKKPFPCGQCSAEFSDEWAQVKHVRLAHTTEYKY